jgi:GAF domain-containing protein
VRSAPDGTLQLGGDAEKGPVIAGVGGGHDPQDPPLEPAPSHDLGLDLQRICRAATDELDLSGAVVTLMTAKGGEAIAAVSDESLRLIEKLQFSMGEGPGREAFVSGRPVLTSDLSDASRWPGYAAAALEAGVGAVYVFPLQLGASRFGLLTLYASAPRALTRHESAACLTFAAQATEVLLDGHLDAPTMLDPTLATALRYRSEVYQAQGLVMMDLGISLVDALARMRAHAFARGMDLDQLAIGIISGAMRLEAENG